MVIEKLLGKKDKEMKYDNTKWFNIASPFKNFKPEPGKEYSRKDIYNK